MKNSDKKQKIHRIYIPYVVVYATKPRKVIPWYKAVKESIYKKKLVECFSTDIRRKKDGKLKFQVFYGLPPKIEKEMEEAQKRGERIKFEYPEGGPPIYPSECFKKKIKALERKSLTRKKRKWYY